MWLEIKINVNLSSCQQLLNIPRAVNTTYDYVQVQQDCHPNFVFVCLLKGKFFGNISLPWMQI